VQPCDSLFSCILAGTGILPVRAHSSANTEAGQDEAVQDKPPHDDDKQKQAFIHKFSLLFYFFRLPNGVWCAISTHGRDKKRETGSPSDFPSRFHIMVPKPGLEPG
jgi:hypothetical protein